MASVTRLSGSKHSTPLWPHRWKGLKVGILGAGKSGLAAARLLGRLGAKVLLSDRIPIPFSLPRGVEKEERGHSSALLGKALLIRSPGVPNHLPILKKARAKHLPIWSELELASRQVQPAAVIAITGTNGKTTTTTLVGELFTAAGRPTRVGGNIGTPLSDLLPHVNPRTTVVLEVSSYQLENIEMFHPTISAILNITADHLEHHGTLRAYTDAKARLFENQGKNDVCVLNFDDPSCRALAKRCRAEVFFFSRHRRLKKGVYFERGHIVVRGLGRLTRWRLDWSLPGDHNIENALASVAIAMAARIPTLVIRNVLRTFHGVEHRLELVRRLNGVSYINDSKGTNVDSTRVALASFREPLVVIMGGQGKGSPYAPLRPLLRGRVQRLLLIGEDAPRIAKELGSFVPTESLETLPRAVTRAREVAEPGQVVLLSPACASFDQYRNYEERGHHFKTLVRRLR